MNNSNYSSIESLIDRKITVERLKAYLGIIRIDLLLNLSMLLLECTRVAQSIAINGFIGYIAVWICWLPQMHCVIRQNLGTVSVEQYQSYHGILYFVQ